VPALRCHLPGGLNFDIDVEYNTPQGWRRAARRDGMTVTFTEEQEELRRTVRRFLEHTSPPSQARRLMDTAEGYDPDVWTRMAHELGLQGLTIPEEYGGSGSGPV
jgi:alkylation response protein AidB-like acyl-CoA dehydrogenase